MLVTVHKHVVAKIARFSVTNDNHKTWLLNIRSVEQQDRGYYMCQINTNPMISQVGYLQVVGECIIFTILHLKILKKSSM